MIFTIYFNLQKWPVSGLGPEMGQFHKLGFLQIEINENIKMAGPSPAGPPFGLSPGFDFFQFVELNLFYFNFHLFEFVEIQKDKTALGFLRPRIQRRGGLGGHGAPAASSTFPSRRRRCVPSSSLRPSRTPVPAAAATHPSDGAVHFDGTFKL